MKKRSALLMMAVICLSMVLSGCNLFALDSGAYYNQTVAAIEYEDKTIKITKEELAQAYSRHGESLSSNGYSQTDAIEYLVNYLINQKVLINQTNELIEDGVIEFTNNHKNDIWNDAYKNVISLLADYETKIYESLNLEQPSELEEEKEKTTFERFNPVSEIIKLNGEYVVRVLDNNDNSQQTLVYDANEDVIDTIIEAVDERIGNNAYLKEAKQQYLNELVAKAKAFKQASDEETVWYNEVERIYNYAKDNNYISLYEEHLVNNGNGVSPISVNDVFKYLENQIAASYNYYSLDLAKYKDEILESRENIHYFFTDKTIGEFFYVSHILVKFSDEQTADLKELEEQFKNGAFATQEDYNNARQFIIDQTVVKSYGEEVKNFTVQNLYNELADALEGKSKEQKAQIFNEYLYQYNEDEGILSGDYNYIVGTESSKMVESFTEAARELYNNGNGEFGDLSGMVESEYGIHILFYVKPLENMFNITNINTFSLTNVSETELEENINIITNTYLSELNNKTVFDIVYEKLKADKLSLMETLDLNLLKENLKITKYVDAYKDMQ